MYARVATVDATELDHLQQVVTAHTNGSHLPEGTRRALGLRDRSGARNLFITLFDTSEALSAAVFAPAAEGDFEPAGRWTAVAAYDVILDSHDDDVIAAVVMTLDAPKHEVGSAVDYVRDHLLPHVREISSCRGALVLANDERHDAVFITLWSTMDRVSPDGTDAHEVAFSWRE